MWRTSGRDLSSRRMEKQGAYGCFSIAFFCHAHLLGARR